MEATKEIIGILSSVLQLDAGVTKLTSESRLLGALPEFDSMAVVAIINILEDYYGFTVNDDELTGSTFETVAQLVEYVEGKLEQ